MALVGGAAAGPLGVAAGALCGGSIAMLLAKKIYKHLKQYLFDRDCNKCLEKAYQTLGVTSNASIDEVNKAYKRLAKNTTPTKVVIRKYL